MAQDNDITVRAEQRTDAGKNSSRRLRARGFVPLTIYGGEGEAVSAAAPLRELAALLRSDTGRNTIFTLDVDGVGASEVMFSDRQIDPIKGRLMHADLKRLVRGQKIEVTVSIHLDGEPIGVAEQEGVLQHVLHEIQISCRPREIPEALHVDVTHMNVHDVLHVSDIKVGETIEILAEPETVVATVGIVREEEVEPTAESTEDDQAEPEVIGKGKKDDEE